jgi:hypothetical protein
MHDDAYRLRRASAPGLRFTGLQGGAWSLAQRRLIDRVVELMSSSIDQDQLARELVERALWK